MVTPGPPPPPRLPAVIHVQQPAFLLPPILAYESGYAGVES